MSQETATPQVTVLEAYKQALMDAMTDDDQVLVLGEDIADPEEGGVVGITRGLSAKFGKLRVRTTPIAEEAIIGAAVGASLVGFKPVAKIMPMNFTTVAMDMIVNHAAKLRYMSGGQMATVRPRVLAMPQAEAGRTGRIIEHALDLAEDDIVTKVLQFVADRDSDQAQLPYADIVVAGGLGLRSAENFQLVKDLAEVLGAEYGGSRPLVQKGWISADRQIGQTGKTIRPKLYITAGISGAIQHRVGVEGSDLIVAINTDPHAQIFEFAHLGIVADAITLLPALTEAFSQRLRVNRLAS